MNRPVQNIRASAIKSSPSMAVSMAARRMHAQGIDVIDLSLGEPDFDTPPHVIDAAIVAMRAGQTRYTGPNGLPELRDAIVGKFARENGLTYARDEIAIGNGAKQIIFNAFLATLEPGDEVIVPAPYWVSYTDIVSLLGGNPRVVRCGVEDGFKLSPDRLKAAITPRTRWLLLNSPSNPSGAIYTAAEYAALGAVLDEHPDVMVMSDEIYEHIIIAAVPFTSFVTACPDLRDRTLILNGVSKAYAMTGWRLGYAAGPKDLITALNKMQSQSTTCPSSVSQAAAVAALNGPQDFVRAAVLEYTSRAKRVVAGLASIPGLQVRAPEGAFYAFPQAAAYIGRQGIASDADLAAHILAHGHVATVPGSAFGLEPCIRLSFATSQANMDRAITRIADALAVLT